ncbi:HD-GYP domain-containing protein (c-di-GMP phosphodiesterase class II) [Bacillus ectoiniformans]|uniref:HD-GYP domain-containing protein n=1 Tax=Bacillus ectoiniformans TaxID=1494429 RepID=UPI001956AC23|nr:HD-GYP domain-containing protein [Bacillus ectoiniformans]MBM7647262.1 HD-GYP domain-containing protein (c-di-GMP phosphodiesterase class II) [Bacillus ectoiniformans]
MRLLAVASLEEDVKLAKPVYNDNGQILISSGIPLTNLMIKRLNQLGISFVYIEDENTEDIIIRPAITESTRREAMGLMKQTFEFVHTDQTLTKRFSFDKVEKQFRSVIRDVIDQVNGHKEAVSMLSEVCAHDNYILNHSLNVTIYALALSMKMKNITKKQLEEIGLGAMLHDVGKLLIPLDILMKPSRLTNEEYAIIKKHTEYGFELLRREHSIPLTAAHCAFQHHERLNGKGYPRGLIGNEIHLYGKIIGIADVYDAVTSNRVYRQAMLPHEGLEILYAGSGTEFDSEMIEAFRKAIVIYPNGLSVHLHDGRRGVVLRQNPAVSDRPVLLILEENLHKVEKPYELDMTKDLTVLISETDTTLLGKKVF